MKMRDREKIAECDFVPVISDGAISIPDFGEGKLIPAVVIDCAKHENIRDLILLQEESSPGDVSSTWGKKQFSSKEVVLILEFKKPIEVKFALKFNTKTQYALIDGIVTAKAVYLQTKESGTKITTSLLSPKMIAEISGDFPNWEKIYHKVLVKNFIKDGAKRKDATIFAQEHKKHTRKFFTGAFRLKAKKQPDK